MEIINEQKQRRKLFRQPSKGRLGGVCAGLADYFDIDANVIRILFIFLFFCPIPTLLPYLIMWLVIPKEE
ncbi:MAG: PspC domain-containing protein [Tidjanibacter sp.]|nr:PspC domain-containing protein [Tidjanibacter sp.]